MNILPYIIATPFVFSAVLFIALWVDFYFYNKRQREAERRFNEHMSKM